MKILGYTAVALFVIAIISSIIILFNTVYDWDFTLI